jgi:hypothetical protein
MSTFNSAEPEAYEARIWRQPDGYHWALSGFGVTPVGGIEGGRDSAVRRLAFEMLKPKWGLGGGEHIQATSVGPESAPVDTTTSPQAATRKDTPTTPTPARTRESRPI